jgi:hypothetical protein
MSDRDVVSGIDAKGKNTLMKLLYLKKLFKMGGGGGK